MRIPIRSIVVLMILTLLAGAVGGWLGVAYGERLASRPSDLHTLIHEDLDLSAAQNRRIETLEAQFDARQKSLEAEMRAANRDLAFALTGEHKYGSRAQAAIDRYHRAEKQLQEATIRHVMAMRAVLNASQSKEFDRAIYEALMTGSS